jgi:hypothetical protein
MAVSELASRGSYPTPCRPVNVTTRTLAHMQALSYPLARSRPFPGASPQVAPERAGNGLSALRKGI